MDNLLHTKPFEHQKEDLEKSYDKEYYAFWWEMGLGKSKIVLDTIYLLWLQGKIKGAIILAPKGNYLNWVYDEIPTHMKPKSYRSGWWGASMRKAEERRYKAFMAAEGDFVKILCMNIESLRYDRGRKVALWFAKHNGPILTCIDESTSIKNSKSKTAKGAYMLAKESSYKRLSTGTPAIQSPVDLFGQCKFLGEGLLGTRLLTEFRSMYTNEIVIKNNAGGQFKKIIGYPNKRLLQDYLMKFSSRRLKSECLDLPDKIYLKRAVPFTNEQIDAYKDMLQLASTEIKGSLITATLAVTLSRVLHRICCGHIKTDDGEEKDIPHNRVETLLQCLEEIGDEKVIIWAAAFKRDIKNVAAALPEGSFETYYGETKNRAEVIKRFKEDKECKYLIANRTGAKGLTLVNSHYQIFYSNDLSPENRVQSEDRQHRSGQKNEVTIIDLVSYRTVDQKIVETFQDKKNIQAALMDYWKELESFNAEEYEKELFNVS